MQWPGKTQRDKGEHLISSAILERISRGEEMVIEDYRKCLEMRDKLRNAFNHIKGKADAYILLSAQGPAPLASDGIGNPFYGDVSSCLASPAYNLPILEDCGLPMGVQFLAHPHQDFELGRIGKWLVDTFLSVPVK